jgi:acetoin utilization deacetylase AcuC-like enzyme
MRMSSDGYAAVVSRLRSAADRVCGGRIAMVTEGGYDLRALAECLTASIAILDGTSKGPESSQSADMGDTRGRAALDAVRAVQKSFWPVI